MLTRCRCESRPTAPCWHFMASLNAPRAALLGPLNRAVAQQRLADGLDGRRAAMRASKRQHARCRLRIRPALAVCREDFSRPTGRYVCEATTLEPERFRPGSIWQ